MAKISSALSCLPPFVFAVLAFAFTIVAITSRDWAQQNHYDPSLDMKDWKTPIYTIYRAPFKICEVSNSANSTTYTLHCNTFKSHGFDKTSCETVFATQNYSNANTGDARLCEQIHFAGNLSITSTTFISLGFLLTLIMTVVSFVYASTTSKDEATSTPTATPDYHSPSYTPYINFFLITSLAIGAVTGILAQFYGIVGFIQSQPSNGAWASARGNVIDPTQDNAAGPWVEGKALRAWITCAWIFSALAAGAAGAVWRLPVWEKVA
ncbi:hypothetical protein GP486_000253 [Trichoglossum hirsutum]|uniref:Uncharacterized protein n=1 Tax=Trichoglossum hirsutum TaxID=265104 RepID=A0A9P8LIW0_9PEZI|nr:hypothetical protein GP486_000253 [Trichoglossum hirsutum]